MADPIPQGCVAYTVQPYDTLDSIATHNNAEVADIKDSGGNALEGSGSALTPGQTIYIQVATETEPVSSLPGRDVSSNFASQLSGGTADWYTNQLRSNKSSNMTPVDTSKLERDVAAVIGGRKTDQYEQMYQSLKQEISHNPNAGSLKRTTAQLELAMAKVEPDTAKQKTLLKSSCDHYSQALENNTDPAQKQRCALEALKPALALDSLDSTQGKPQLEKVMNQLTELRVEDSTFSTWAKSARKNLAENLSWWNQQARQNVFDDLQSIAQALQAPADFPDAAAYKNTIERDITRYMSPEFSEQQYQKNKLVLDRPGGTWGYGENQFTGR